MNGAGQTRVLLLVEDNPGDAQLVTEMLAEARREEYEIIHVVRLADAVETLRTTHVDVVVLDLRLPDCSGMEGLKAVRETAAETPIVVLTGNDDEELALDCINAGAQDYLAKAETRSQNLKRAIGYAISRMREVQLRELQETLDRYRSLSSSTQRTTVTAAIAGSGAISMRSPALFDEIGRGYYALLEPYLARETDRIEASRNTMERVITMLGDANGGPRDLLDVHVGALDRAIAMDGGPRARTLVVEARLLALEMMGLLVDYYRVGHRRRFVEGARS